MRGALQLLPGLPRCGGKTLRPLPDSYPQGLRPLRLDRPPTFNNVSYTHLSLVAATQSTIYTETAKLHTAVTKPAHVISSSNMRSLLADITTNLLEYTSTSAHHLTESVTNINVHKQPQQQQQLSAC